MRPSVLIALPLLVTATPLAVAQEKRVCKGTQQFYAGRCRYPEDIAAMKAEDARRHAAERERRERQERNEQLERQLDEAACDEARTSDTLDGWSFYLRLFPHGACSRRARARIEALDPRPKRFQPELAPAPLPPLAGAVPLHLPPPAPESARDGEDAHRGGLPGWSIAGFVVSGAGLAIGVVAGAIALGRRDALWLECPDNRCTTPTHRELLDRGLAAAHVATAGFIACGIGAAVGVAGALVAHGSEGSAEIAIGTEGIFLRGNF